MTHAAEWATNLTGVGRRYATQRRGRIGQPVPAKSVASVSDFYINSKVSLVSLSGGGVRGKDLSKAHR